MKRHILFLILLNIGTLGLMAQNVLVVRLADGGQHIFQLSERPELLWEGDNILISTSNTELTIPRSDFRGFGASDPDALKSIGADGSKIAIDANGKLKAEGLKAGSTIRIYDSMGRQVSLQSVSSNGRATVKLSGKPSGAYFVKIGDQPTIKILKP